MFAPLFWVLLSVATQAFAAGELTLTLVNKDVAGSASYPVRTVGGAPRTDIKLRVMVPAVLGELRNVAFTVTHPQTSVGDIQQVGETTPVKDDTLRVVGHQATFTYTPYLNGPDFFNVQVIAKRVYNSAFVTSQVLQVGIYNESANAHFFKWGASLGDARLKLVTGLVNHEHPPQSVVVAGRRRSDLSGVFDNSYSACELNSTCSKSMPSGAWYAAASATLSSEDILVKESIEAGFYWPYFDMPRSTRFISPFKFKAWDCRIGTDGSTKINCANGNSSAECRLPEQGIAAPAVASQITCWGSYVDNRGSYPTLTIEFPYPGSGIRATDDKLYAKSVTVSGGGVYNRKVTNLDSGEAIGTCSGISQKGCGDFDQTTYKYFQPGETATVVSSAPLQTTAGAYGLLGWVCESQYYHPNAVPVPQYPETYSFKACNATLNLPFTNNLGGHTGVGYKNASGATDIGNLGQTKCRRIWGACALNDPLKPQRDSFGKSCTCKL